MGYDISQETYERIEANRRDGRLCQGSSRCSTRATKVSEQQCWTYTIDEGMMPEISTLVLCAKHAREYPPGYRGINFIVLSVKDLPRYTNKERA